VPAQTRSAGWTRVESDNKEFSCILPTGFSITIDKEGFLRSDRRDPKNAVQFTNIRSFGGYSDGISVYFETYDTADPKKGIALLTDSISNAEMSQMSFENFTIRQVLRAGEGNSVQYYFAGKSQVYLVGLGTRDADSQAAVKFLSAIQLNGKAIFNSPVPPFPGTGASSRV
jgi:hypothetical protein